MCYNKYNVLHWHITDDESFPIESTSFPNLANQGSFGADGRHVYSTEDVASIIEFARMRGIRVIPEFDMPGHSGAWSKSHPELFSSTSTPFGTFDVASPTLFEAILHV